MSVHSARVHIVFDKDFLEEVDKYAAAHWLSRSDLIRISLMEKLGLKFMGDTLNSGPSDDEILEEVAKQILEDSKGVG